MVKYKSYGLITPLVFDDCECDLPEKSVASAIPYFYATMESNQSISGYGETVIEFDTLAVDTSGEYSETNHGFTAEDNASYEIEANISVYNATDEQVPSYISIYDSTNSTTIAKGIISASTVNHVAQFYIKIGSKEISPSGLIVIRFLALTSCTVYSDNSWFTARKLYWTSV